MGFIAVEPVVRKFNRHQEGNFREALEEMDRHAIFYPVTTARELTLDRDGRTVTDGLRLTTWALYQVCQTACPGLYKFVGELSGVNRLDSQARADYSFDEALEIFNQVVRRRFSSRLYGHQVVRNSHDGLIEGLVGTRYKRLSNVVLYEQAKAVLGQLRRPPAFYEATLNGRWLLLRYYNAQTFFFVEGPDGGRDRFLSGYHFSNNEVGKGAARAAAFILRDTGRTSSLCSSLSGGRVRHLGLKFERKIQKLLGGVLDRLREPDFYRSRVLALRSAKLGLGRDDPTGSNADDLRHTLTRRKIPVSLARGVISSALSWGSYDDKSLRVPHLVNEEATARTPYDLYNALGREATDLSINVREQVEQVAYALLAGKFSVNQGD